MLKVIYITKYLFIIILLFSLSCTSDNNRKLASWGNDPIAVPANQVDIKISDNDNLSGDYWYHYSCASPEVLNEWNEIWELIGNKEYQAIYNGDYGSVTVIENDFGIKYDSEYQYGLLLNTINIERIVTITIWVEPLGFWAIRIKLMPSGIDKDSVWIGLMDKYTPELHKPALLFVQDYLNDDYNCKRRDMAFLNSFINVEGSSLLDIEMLCGKFYSTYYDDVKDEIHGYIELQCFHERFNKPFVQIWEIILERSL